VSRRLSAFYPCLSFIGQVQAQNTKFVEGWRRVAVLVVPPCACCRRSSFNLRRVSFETVNFLLRVTFFMIGVPFQSMSQELGGQRVLG
jgi:hypothetical protein